MKYCKYCDKGPVPVSNTSSMLIKYIDVTLFILSDTVLRWFEKDLQIKRIVWQILTFQHYKARLVSQIAIISIFDGG